MQLQFFSELIQQKYSVEEYPCSYVFFMSASAVDWEKFRRSDSLKDCVSEWLAPLSASVALVYKTRRRVFSQPGLLERTF